MNFLAWLSKFQFGYHTLIVCEYVWKWHASANAGEVVR